MWQKNLQTLTVILFAVLQVQALSKFQPFFSIKSIIHNANAVLVFGSMNLILFQLYASDVTLAEIIIH